MVHVRWLYVVVLCLRVRCVWVGLPRHHIMPSERTLHGLMYIHG